VAFEDALVALRDDEVGELGAKKRRSLLVRSSSAS
jgi:hypothetical protein